MRRFAGLLLGLLLVLPGALGCSQEPVIQKVAPRAADTLVKLPDGSVVHAELAVTQAEREYGLMDRTSLPRGRGMLFVHDGPGRYPYWMYHCKIGLDIIWMDRGHKIVGMSADTPPCKGKARTCPSYGGREISQYVLELPEGSIDEHRLAVGQVLNFNVGN
ncbi:MAG TPA: DUF192 domain-containing protein [Acidobacteriaceae bacterium]|nr:DUF192 domain-containing protein [Acidobacteriaceae bacterium]